ncbi:unnamed protein product [Discosporangium mesarthrocarpum]
MAATVACHPMDTIRTRLQAASTGKFNGVWSCVTHTMKHEGVAAFYKGMAFPLGAQAVYKAVIFTVNGNAKRALATRGLDNTTLGVFSCGALSGVVNAFIVSPVELVRNRLMLQYKKGWGVLSGPLECVQHITRSRGLIGMWQGLWATVLRDGGGVGLYFLVFEASKRSLVVRTNDEGAKAVSALGWGQPAAGNGVVLLAGSAAGIAFWAYALPLDAAKTLIQAAELPRGQPTPALGATMARLLQEGGVPRLFRGWPVAIGRGIPGAAITMFTYGKVAQAIG